MKRPQPRRRAPEIDKLEIDGVVRSQFGNRLLCAQDTSTAIPKLCGNLSIFRKRLATHFWRFPTTLFRDFRRVFVRFADWSEARIADMSLDLFPLSQIDGWPEGGKLP